MKSTIAFLLVGDDTRNDNGKFNDSDNDSKNLMTIIRRELVDNVSNILQPPSSIIDLHINDINR